MQVLRRKLRQLRGWLHMKVRPKDIELRCRCGFLLAQIVGNFGGEAENITVHCQCGVKYNLHHVRLEVTNNE